MTANYIERNETGGAPGFGQNPGMPAQRGPRSGDQPIAPGAPGIGESSTMQHTQSLNSGGTTTMKNGQDSMSNGSEEFAIAPKEPGARDYRDDLRDLLDRAHSERGLTRYRLCKQMGIDSGTLSNVLAKRRHFSLEKLEQILGLLGYRLSFTPTEAGPRTA
jgi:hypothetical protein